MNPFIRLLTDPIHTLTLTGYGLLMLILVIGGLSHILRKGVVVLAASTYEHRRRKDNQYDEWWGEWAGGYIPPGGWLRDAAGVLLAGVGMMWALATIVYIATHSI